MAARIADARARGRDAARRGAGRSGRGRAAAPRAWPEPRGRVAWGLVPSFSHSVELSQPPEDVFPWLLEEDKVPQWTSDLQSYAVDGPLGAGRAGAPEARRRRRPEADMEIVALRPAARRGDALRDQRREGRRAPTCSSRPARGTRLTQTLEAKAGGLTGADADPGRPGAAGEEADRGPRAAARGAGVAMRLLGLVVAGAARPRRHARRAERRRRRRPTRSRATRSTSTRAPSWPTRSTRTRCAARIKSAARRRCSSPSCPQSAQVDSAGPDADRAAPGRRAQGHLRAGRSATSSARSGTASTPPRPARAPAARTRTTPGDARRSSSTAPARRRTTRARAASAIGAIVACCCWSSSWAAACAWSSAAAAHARAGADGRSEVGQIDADRRLRPPRRQHPRARARRHARRRQPRGQGRLRPRRRGLRPRQRATAPRATTPRPTGARRGPGGDRLRARAARRPPLGSNPPRT